MFIRNQFGAKIVEIIIGDAFLKTKNISWEYFFSIIRWIIDFISNFVSDNGFQITASVKWN